jgi:hypothetical protein
MVPLSSASGHAESTGEDKPAEKNIDCPPPVNFCAWLVGNLKEATVRRRSKAQLAPIGKARSSPRSRSQESTGSKVRDEVVAHYVGLSLPTDEHLRAGGIIPRVVRIECALHFLRRSLIDDVGTVSERSGRGFRGHHFRLIPAEDYIVPHMAKAMLESGYCECQLKAQRRAHPLPTSRVANPQNGRRMDVTQRALYANPRTIDLASETSQDDFTESGD